MITRPTNAAMRSTGRVLANEQVSSGLIRLDMQLDLCPGFEPGQFAMINLTGAMELVFSRPFSILAVQDRVLSLLYRVVGRGTRAMQQLRPDDNLTVLGPLGRPFSTPAEKLPVVLIGGGVGLPPVWAWLKQYGRPDDIGFFGARDGADVPWDLLDDRWRISVDNHRQVPADRAAWQGLVPDLVAKEISPDDHQSRLVMACGPIPLLKAAADLARDRHWPCQVSLEEHMGCGYGACKGCVVPVIDLNNTQDSWRNATCCQDGPVFSAESIDWSSYSRHDFDVID